MPADRTQAIHALLADAQQAHSVFERNELNGVYDQNWPQWYGAYAVEHGIGALIGHEVRTEDLAAFLASTNAEFEQAKPKLAEPWDAYTARRIAAEL